MLKYAALSLLVPAVLGGERPAPAMPDSMAVDICAGNWGLMIETQESQPPSWKFSCHSTGSNGAARVDITPIRPEGMATLLTQVLIAENLPAVRILVPCGASDICTALGYPSMDPRLDMPAFKATDCRVWVMARSGYPVEMAISDNATLKTCRSAVARYNAFQQNIFITRWVEPQPEGIRPAPVFAAPSSSGPV